MATDTLTTLNWSIIFAAVIGGLLPALFWLWFWLKEDRQRPEPPGLLLLVFILGGLAIIPPFLIQNWLRVYLGLTPESNLLLVIVLWAVTEELAKFLAVYFSAFQNKSFDEPVDAMIYLITAALGFAAVENSLFLIAALRQGGLGTEFLLTGNFRFIGATLLHVASSALLGIFLAWAFCKLKKYKPFYFLAGLLTATLLHTMFNYLIITSKNDNLLPVFLLLWAVTLVVIFIFEPIKKIVCPSRTQTK